MNIKSLSYPPIQEAVIEVRFNSTRDVTIEKLRAFATSINGKFPDTQELKTQVFKIESAKVSQEDNGHAGFRCFNTTKTQSILCAYDRISYSAISKYPGWDEFKEEFKNLYIDFVSNLPFKHVSRIGVRYINNVELEFNIDEKLDIEEYILTFPPLPKAEGLSNYIESYSLTSILPFDDLKEAKAKIQQNFAGEKSKIHPENAKVIITPFYLDIDVFSTITTQDTQDSKLWEMIERLREKKNLIFFNTLSERALAKYG